MEIFVEIQENVRGNDVFVLQSTSFPANDNLMELLILIDALKRASARRITAVLPYFGYARQDRKPGPRTPISAKLVADIITTAGGRPRFDARPARCADPGVFRYSNRQLVCRTGHGARHSRADVDREPRGCIAGRGRRGSCARALAKRIGCPIAICDKRRDRPGEAEVMNVIGDVRGKACVLIDDIIDSGGTLCSAAGALLKSGALEVSAYITHGVLSGGAVSRIQNSDLTSLVITDSIQPTAAVLAAKNIRVISVAPLLGEAIYRTSREESVSSLFY